MNMVSKLAAGVALSALMATGAMASDIFAGDKSLKDDANYASGSTVNWTGLYIQGQAGWVNGTHDISLEAPAPAGTLFDFDGISANGGIGGARIGFDFARSRFLIGIFADYNWSGAETSIEAGGTKVALFEKDHEWTAGVRAGYLLAPRTLLYGLVGYTESGFDIGTVSFDTDGVTAGGGIEVALIGNVAIGLEASHTWYDDVTLVPGSLKLNDELDETRIMGTLKLKLNGGLFGN